MSPLSPPGLSVRFVSIPTLIGMKEVAGRPRDLDDVEHRRWILEAEDKKMSDADEDIDWSKTTFEGSRREQLRRWCALSVRQRLEALHEMTDLSTSLVKESIALRSLTPQSA